jgi:hypothetical protein
MTDPGLIGRCPEKCTTCLLLSTSGKFDSKTFIAQITPGEAEESVANLGGASGFVNRLFPRGSNGFGFQPDRITLNAVRSHL